MEQQNQEVADLRKQLTIIQSRAFEMNSQLTAERDAARQSVESLQQFNSQIAGALGLAQTTTEDVLKRITDLVASESAHKNTASPAILELADVVELEITPDVQ